MRHKASWAIGLTFVLAQAALGQTVEQPDKVGPPQTPGVNLDSPSGAPALPFAPAARRSPLFYFDADYLLWWVNHGPSPNLLNTAPNNGISPNTITGIVGLNGGIQGQIGTQTLFDSHQLTYDGFSGFRAKAGIGLGDDGFWSLELGGFYLPKQSINFVRTGNPDGTPLLTVPFIDASTGLPQALDISSQTISNQPYLSGSIAIHSDLQVWGYEMNLIAHSIRTADRSVDLWLGLRSLTMDENLSINQTITPAQSGDITIQYPSVGLGQNNYFPTAAGAPVFVVDHFRTSNRFYGAQVGARFGWDLAGFMADLTMKVAVGATHQEASIDGSSTATALINGVPQVVTTPGGTFALLNNTGNYAQNQFTVVPEIGLNLKYAITPSLIVQFGYSGTYWSNVARPGAQIDPVLNSKLIPTGGLIATNTTGIPGAFLPGQEQGRPYFAFHDTAFWAQGLNVGVEFRY